MPFPLCPFHSSRVWALKPFVLCSLRLATSWRHRNSTLKIIKLPRTHTQTREPRSLWCIRTRCVVIRRLYPETRVVSWFRCNSTPARVSEYHPFLFLHPTLSWTIPLPKYFPAPTLHPLVRALPVYNSLFLFRYKIYQNPVHLVPLRTSPLAYPRRASSALCRGILAQFCNSFRRNKKHFVWANNSTRLISTAEYSRSLCFLPHSGAFWRFRISREIFTKGKQWRIWWLSMKNLRQPPWQ